MTELVTLLASATGRGLVKSLSGPKLMQQPVPYRTDEIVKFH